MLNNNGNGVNMNIADRVVNYFSPKAGANRLLHRKLSAAATGYREPGYTSAGASRRSLLEWFPSLMSARTELSESERKTLVARAYDAYRNQEIARAAVNRIKTCAISTGLNLIPLIDNEYLGLSPEQTEELENTIDREFDIFSESCDVERSSNLAQLQALALATTLITGDCFVNTLFVERPGDLYGLKLQFIDGERVCNPDNGVDRKGLIKGIEIDKYGAPKAYHVLSCHPSDAMILGNTGFEWDRFPVFGRISGRRRFLHVFDKDRNEQVRGISYLAPILEPLKQLKRYEEAELMAAVLTGMLTFFIESDEDEENMGFAQTDEQKNAGKGEFSLGYGAAVELEKGKKVNAVMPTRPNSSFDPFIMAITRHIGAALDLPAEEILLKFDKSFSAARAAMLKAWHLYRVKRQLIISKFCQPVYSLWFDEAVARGVLPYINNYADPRRRFAYQRSQWIGVGRGAIDESKEADAARKRIEMHVSNEAIEAAELKGVHWKAVLRQKAKILREMDRLGIPVIIGNESEVVTEEDLKDESIQPAIID